MSEQELVPGDHDRDRQGSMRETTKLLVTWGLNLATTVALGLGAHMYNTLASGVERLNANLSRFEAKVAVLESTAARQAALEAEVSALKATVAAQSAKIDLLMRKDGGR